MNTSSQSFYPVVRDLADVEYGCYCGVEDESDVHHPRQSMYGSRALHQSHSPLFAPYLGELLDDTKDTQVASAHSKRQQNDGTRSRKSDEGSFAPYLWELLDGAKDIRGASARSKRQQNDGTRSIKSDESTTVDCSDSIALETGFVEEKEYVKFQDAYVITRQVFRCKKSEIFDCVERKSGKKYCVKIVNLRSLETPKLIEDTRREAELFQLAQECPQVAKLIQVMEEHGKLYIVMEFYPRGNLLSEVVNIHEKTGNAGLPENQAKHIAISILQGCKYFHSKLHICHNNLQPSNILLDGAGNAKICDFGCARHQETASVFDYLDVAPAYAAPEVLSRLSYNTPQADMWTVGVVIYFVLFGKTPFGGSSSTSKLTVSRVHRVHYTFPGSETSAVSRQAKQFLSALIQSDPTVRLTAQEALEHPWLAGDAVYKKKKSSDIQENVYDNIDHNRGFASNDSTANPAGGTSFVKKILQNKKCGSINTFHTLSSAGLNIKNKVRDGTTFLKCTRRKWPWITRLNSSRNAKQ